MDEQTRTAIIEYAQTVEAAAAKLKQAIATLSLDSNTQGTTNEAVFSALVFEKRTSPRLGEYEVAQKTANNQTAWEKALNVLEKCNAAISSRHHAEDYQYSYWLYGEDTIYRQKLKPQQQTSQGAQK